MVDFYGTVFPESKNFFWHSKLPWKLNQLFAQDTDAFHIRCTALYPNLELQT